MGHYDGCREGYCWRCECTKEQCIEDGYCRESKRWKREARVTKALDTVKKLLPTKRRKTLGKVPAFKARKPQKEYAVTLSAHAFVSCTEYVKAASPEKAMEEAKKLDHTWVYEGLDDDVSPDIDSVTLQSRPDLKGWRDKEI